MANIWSTVTGVVDQISNLLPTSRQVEQVIVKEVQGMSLPCRGIIRIAGLSGATAVSLGAYGAHAFAKKEDVDQKRKDTFDTANKYHMFHTLALIGVPMTRQPILTGTLMTSGMLLFCGSCYYHALTGNLAVRKVTPYGGFLLIFAWLSMAL